MNDELFDVSIEMWLRRRIETLEQSLRVGDGQLDLASSRMRGLHGLLSSIVSGR
jgi:hypothetical protein